MYSLWLFQVSFPGSGYFARLLLALGERSLRTVQYFGRSSAESSFSTAEKPLPSQMLLGSDHVTSSTTAPRGPASPPQREPARSRRGLSTASFSPPPRPRWLSAALQGHRRGLLSPGLRRDHQRLPGVFARFRPGYLHRLLLRARALHRRAFGEARDEDVAATVGQVRAGPVVVPATTRPSAATAPVRPMRDYVRGGRWYLTRPRAAGGRKTGVKPARCAASSTRASTSRDGSDMGQVAKKRARWRTKAWKEK